MFNTYLDRINAVIDAHCRKISQYEVKFQYGNDSISFIPKDNKPYWLCMKEQKLDFYHRMVNEIFQEVHDNRG